MIEWRATEGRWMREVREAAEGDDGNESDGDDSDEQDVIISLAREEDEDEEAVGGDAVGEDEGEGEEGGEEDETAAQGKRNGRWESRELVFQVENDEGRRGERGGGAVVFGRRRQRRARSRFDESEHSGWKQ